MKKYTIVILLFVLLLVSCNKNPVTRTEGEWEKSSTFSINIKGVKKAEDFIGVKGKIGLTSMDFFAEKPLKFLVFFWGKPEEIQKKSLRVEAVSKESNQKIVIGEIKELTGAAPDYEGAIASANLTATFPSKGLWKINLYLDNQLYDSIVIEVKN